MVYAIIIWVINMQTLILNGSPRKDGNTSFIINKIKDRLNAYVVNSFDIQFSHCIDCNHCKNGKCIFDDELTKMIDNIDNFDNIIIASPLYYNQPTGSILSLASRFQIIFNSKKKLKEKNGGIIVTGGGDTVVNSADAEKTIRIILRGLNIKEFSYIRSLYTSTIPADKDKTIDNQINEFIKKMNL